MNSTPYQEAAADFAALDAFANSCVRRWASLPERSMRAAALRAFLASTDPSQSVHLLDNIVQGALHRRADHTLVYDSMLLAHDFFGAIGATQIERLCQDATAQRCVAANLWLNTLVSNDQRLRIASPRVDRSLGHLTLGDRRALARRARGDTLLRLLADPDPGVIKNLLHNRQTTLQTVLIMCSKRPAAAASLVEVLRNDYWNRFYEVRLALVKNPYLPVPYATNLLVCLLTPDIVEARNNNEVSPLLRLAADRLLQLLPQSTHLSS